MQFHCHDPFNAVSRVIDIARRLDLPFSRLSYVRQDDGRFLLDLELMDMGGNGAQVFASRLVQLVDLESEAYDA